MPRRDAEERKVEEIELGNGWQVSDLEGEAESSQGVSVLKKRMFRISDSL